MTMQIDSFNDNVDRVYLDLDFEILSLFQLTDKPLLKNVEVWLFRASQKTTH